MSAVLQRACVTVVVYRRYPTFLGLAGLSPSDIADDVLYNGTMRSLDGLDAWPTIIGATKEMKNSNGGQNAIVLDIV